MSLTPPREAPRTRPALALAIDALYAEGHHGLLPALRAHAAAAVQSTAVATAIRPLTALPAKLVLDALARALRLAPDAIGLGDPGDRDRAAALADALIDALRAPVGASAGTAATAPPPLICAPGAVDRHGQPRFDPRALTTLADRLWRHAEAVVLDTAEAALLTGRPAPDLPRMREAAKRLSDHGSAWVIVTGGRAEGHAIDLAYDGNSFTEFGADRAPLARLTGTGATFAGLIVAHRARGLPLLEAVQAAKQGIVAALAHPAPIGPTHRLDPLAPAFAALGFETRPIEVPPDPPPADELP